LPPRAWFVGHDGKAAPEALYGYLYHELHQSLKATGKSGVTESKRLESEPENACVSFENQAEKI
jgi:hypothetical protein